MLKNYTFLFILILLSTKNFAQNKTYLGVEGAITYDMFSVKDEGNKIFRTRLDEPAYGITFSQEIHKNFLLETGIISKNYQQGYRYIEPGYMSGTRWNAFMAWQIPLRLKAKINLFKDRVYFTTITGYSLCINREFGKKPIVDFYHSNDPNNMEIATYNAGLAKHFSLIETGGGIEFKILKTALLSFTFSYFTGFTNTTEIDISYTEDGSPDKKAHAISKGDYWNINCSLRYPISNFWRKSE